MVRPRSIIISVALLSALCAEGQQTNTGSLVVQGNLTVTGSAVAASTNGVLNANAFSGSDIGAQVNAAFAALPTGGSVLVPAGSYNFATTIVVPKPGYQLQCDAGTVLNYTGGNDAILIPASTSVPGQANLGVDGKGGCLLQGNNHTGNGIHINPSNQTYVTGMRIEGFKDGIFITGGNGIQILNNTFKSNTYGLAMTTVPNYAPNAVHVAFNEFASNGWGVYSYNGNVSATPAFGNVYRDNVFEGQTSGDIYLAWDAHTIVAGNYFESSGVGVSVGAGLDNVFDVHVEDNYFTSTAYRSNVELGYGFDFVVQGNHEEGATTSECAVNMIPGSNGSISNPLLTNAFSPSAFGGNRSTNEVCLHGSPVATGGGTFRFASSTLVGGDSTTEGNQTVKGGTIKLGSSQLTFTSARPSVGGSCAPEGFMFVSTTSPAHLYLCSASVWRQLY